MEQELQLVADFDFDMIVDFFSRLNRQGPGSQQVTRQALSFIGELSDNAKIADIGCGSGGQTITLIPEDDHTFKGTCHLSWTQRPDFRHCRFHGKPTF